MLRKLFYLILSLLILFALLLGVAYWKSDWIVARFKPAMEELLTSAAGAPVHFEEVKLNLFPIPALETGALSLNLKNGLQIRVPHLKAQISLRELLARRITVTDIEIYQPDVRIDISPSARAARAKKLPEAENSNKEAAAFSDVELEKITIREGTLHFLGAGALEQLTFTKVNVSLGALISARAVNLDSIKVSGLLPSFSRELPIALNATDFQIDTQNESLLVRGGELQTAGQVFTIEGKSKFDFSEGKYALKAQAVSFAALNPILKNIAPKILAYDISGTISLDGVVRLASGQQILEADAVCNDIEASAFGHVYRHIKGKIGVKSDFVNTQINSEELTLKLDSETQPVKARVNLSLPALQGKLLISADSLPATAVMNVLSSFAPQSVVAVSAGSVQPKILVNFSPQGVTAVEGIVGLERVSAKVMNNQLSDALGNVKFTYNQSGTKLVLEDIRANAAVGAKPLQVSGVIGLEPLSLDLKANVTEANVAELCTLSTACGDINPTGVIDAELHILKSATELQPHVEGKVNLRALSLSAGAAVIENARGTLQLGTAEGGQSVSTENVELSLNGAPIRATFELIKQPLRVKITSSQINGFSGQADIEGVLTLNESKDLKARIRASKLDVAALGRAFKMFDGTQIQGQVSELDFDFSTSTAMNLMSHLNGVGKIKVLNGVVKDVNLGQLVLEKIDNIPLLQGALYDQIPAEFHKYFETKDTKIRVLSADVKAENGEIELFDAKLLSEVFAIVGQGTVSAQSELKFDTEFLFEPTLSKAILRRVKELKMIVNERGEIVIPVEVAGVLPDVSVKPDIGGLVQKGVSGLAVDILEQLLNKAGEGN